MFEFITGAALLSLFTLTFLEVILGVDNVVFIAIAAGKMPPKDQDRVRFIGLAIAMLLRIVMLASLVWLLKAIDVALFEFSDEIVGALGAGHASEEIRQFTVKDLVLLLGGGFLLYQGTQEIMHMSEPHHGPGSAASAKQPQLAAVIAQLFVINFVFSLDSVITAIGMTDILWVMVTAVVLSSIMMVWLAKPLSDFIDRRPTVKTLALSFILLIGVALIADGLGIHLPRGYVYFGIGFSLFVYALNSWIEGRRAGGLETGQLPGARREH